MNTQKITGIITLTIALGFIGINTAQAKERNTRHTSHSEQRYATDSNQHRQAQSGHRRHDEQRYDNDSRQHNRKKPRRHRRVAESPRVHRYQHKRGVLHHHPSHYAHPHKSWRRHHARWGHQNSRRHVRNDISHGYYRGRHNYSNHDRYYYRGRYYK